MEQGLFDDLLTEDDLLLIISIVLFIAFVIAFSRNIFNVYKKRAYKKENNALKEYVVANEKAVTGYSKQLRDIEKLEKELLLRHEKSMFLEKELKTIKRNSEKKISTLGQEINHQQRAFEKYADYKSVEANNTRLGAHFIKNVINQVYMDLESARANYKTIWGVHYKIGKSEMGIPPIDALKNIFNLLDYNVAALNKTAISITEELKYVEMFLELIRYLKPNAKIELEDLLNDEQRSTLEIKPTLFFPFVENALKHGSLNDENSFITIKLEQNEHNKLNYSLINSAEVQLEHPVKITDTESGFGLNALEQLINTYYPGSKLSHEALPNKQYISRLTLAIAS
ncbi:hypothetical protein IMCC3317_43290 [Kordia antarctica]|uniref:Histidine kinase n=1 Tax=Kordia antarctica TaxID=1218801 RepID=A0A7L4ZR12_9FLAO|nr:hypothetical protein [Kordia antarctica]QHI38929.1 hypothetical protein IMCC3317_43290 [Kordia antarctica]